MTANYAHQEHIFGPQFARPVIIMGGGAIGGFTAYALNKMGVPDITVWDGDVVSSHNTPMSIYRPADLGRHKVDALQEIIEWMTGSSIKTVKKFYVDESLKHATIISCVDLMSARTDLWAQVKDEFTIDLFIDTRTAAAYGEIFAINPRLDEDQKRYESLLFPDSEAALQTCGNHGYIASSMGVAADVAATLARFWQTGQKKWRYAKKYDTVDQV